MTYITKKKHNRGLKIISGIGGGGIGGTTVLAALGTTNRSGIIERFVPPIVSIA